MSAMPNVGAASGSFVPDDFLASCGNCDRSTADNAPFGVVKVDDSGKILLYNKWEADMAGITPTNAEGKNFFTQVSPCSNNGLFFGTFKKGVASGHMNVVFPYTFTYKMRPTNVKIHLYRDGNTKSNFIFVTKA
jgi:photoactive yellow protein